MATHADSTGRDLFIVPNITTFFPGGFIDEDDVFPRWKLSCITRVFDLLRVNGTTCHYPVVFVGAPHFSADHVFTPQFLSPLNSWALHMQAVEKVNFWINGLEDNQRLLGAPIPGAPLWEIRIYTREHYLRLGTDFDGDFSEYSLTEPENRDPWKEILRGLPFKFDFTGWGRHPWRKSLAQRFIDGDISVPVDIPEGSLGSPNKVTIVQGQPEYLDFKSHTIIRKHVFA